MTLSRKILCMTNAALLSVSVYASDLDDSGVNQASVPVSVSGVNWNGASVTVALVAVGSSVAYYGADEMNRMMNMSLQARYYGGMVAVVIMGAGLCSGQLFASEPSQRTNGTPATTVAAALDDASPSRGYGTVNVKAELDSLTRARGFFSDGKNKVLEKEKLQEVASVLNDAVTFLQARKDHYKLDSQRLSEDLSALQLKLTEANEKVTVLKEENIQLKTRAEGRDEQIAALRKQAEEAAAVLAENQTLKVELARNEGKDARIRELVAELISVKKDLLKETADRSKQQTEAGAAVLKLNEEISRLRGRLEKLQSSVSGSVVDPSECGRSETGRSVGSTMRRNVETFYGEILDRDEREVLRAALVKYREEKAAEKEIADAASRKLAEDAASALDDVV